MAIKFGLFIRMLVYGICVKCEITTLMVWKVVDGCDKLDKIAENDRVTRCRILVRSKKYETFLN